MSAHRGVPLLESGFDVREMFVGMKTWRVRIRKKAVNMEVLVAQHGCVC